MYRISAIVLVAATACFSGCSDNTEAPKQQIVSVVESARKADLIQKMDQDLNGIARKIRGKQVVIPTGDVGDHAMGLRASSALMTYFEIPEIVGRVERDPVSDLIASARKLASADVELFDQAVLNIESQMRQGSFIRQFPNYSVFSFIQAIVEIVSNDIFEVKTEAAKVSVLSNLLCASDASECGIASPLTARVLAAIERVKSVIPAEIPFSAQDEKAVFAVFYVLFNHAAIPVEYREFFMSMVDALVDLIVAIVPNPESAQEVLADLVNRIQLTPREMVLIGSIRQHIEVIARAFNLGDSYGALTAQVHLPFF
jgi:hypothetical protein